VRAFAGPITRDLANGVLAAAQAEFLDWRQRNPQLTGFGVDLANVGRVDTSALAVVLAFQRYARGMGVELVWHSMPETLLELAKLSSVDQLLPRA